MQEIAAPMAWSLLAPLAPHLNKAKTIGYPFRLFLNSLRSTLHDKLQKAFAFVLLDHVPQSGVECTKPSHHVTGCPMGFRLISLHQVLFWL